MKIPHITSIFQKKKSFFARVYSPRLAFLIVLLLCTIIFVIHRNYGYSLGYYLDRGKSETIANLSPLQYRVAFESVTEPAFSNAYWDHKEPGIYVDIVDGVALFSSLDKYDSGTGWPTFSKPITPMSVTERPDNTLWMERIEVVSRSSGIHLGHLFDDGPANLGGKRYCMNSASLRFIPASELQNEGYPEYLPLFMAP